MWLYIRMVMYFISASLAGQGWLEWNPHEASVKVYIDQLEPLFMGIGGFVMTFFASRFAKNRGGKT